MPVDPALSTDVAPGDAGHDALHNAERGGINTLSDDVVALDAALVALVDDVTTIGNDVTALDGRVTTLEEAPAPSGGVDRLSFNTADFVKLHTIGGSTNRSFVNEGMDVYTFSSSGVSDTIGAYVDPELMRGWATFDIEVVLYVMNGAGLGVQLVPRTAYDTDGALGNPMTNHTPVIFTIPGGHTGLGPYKHTIIAGLAAPDPDVHISAGIGFRRDTGGGDTLTSNMYVSAMRLIKAS